MRISLFFVMLSGSQIGPKLCLSRNKCISNPIFRQFVLLLYREWPVLLGYVLTVAFCAEETEISISFSLQKKETMPPGNKGYLASLDQHAPSAADN